MTKDKHKPLTQKDIWSFETTTHIYKSYYEDDVLSALQGLKEDLIDVYDKNNVLTKMGVKQMIDKWFQLKVKE